MIAIVNIQDNKILMVKRVNHDEWTCPITEVSSGRDEAKLFHDFRRILGPDLKIKERLGDFYFKIGPRQTRVISVFIVDLLGSFNINYHYVTTWKYMNQAEYKSNSIDSLMSEQIIPAIIKKRLLYWVQ